MWEDGAQVRKRPPHPGHDVLRGRKQSGGND